MRISLSIFFCCLYSVPPLSLSSSKDRRTPPPPSLPPSPPSIITTKQLPFPTLFCTYTRSLFSFIPIGGGSRSSPFLFSLSLSLFSLVFYSLSLLVPTFSSSFAFTLNLHSLATVSTLTALFATRQSLSLHYSSTQFNQPSLRYTDSNRRTPPPVHSSVLLFDCA